MLADSGVTTETGNYRYSLIMAGYGKQFGLLIVAVVLSILPVLSAETWYLERGRDWKLLSDESRKAFVKAEKLQRKGKLTKAAGSYDKFLKDCDPKSELYALALERQFSIAEKLLAGRKIRVLGIFKMKGYAYGIRIMDGITERAGLEDANGIGIRAARAVALCYEDRAKRDKGYYELAYLKWLEIFEAFNTRAPMALPPARDQMTEILKQALLAMARCKQLQYNGPKYNASTLTGRTLKKTKRRFDNARSCYEEFIIRYPGDAQKLNIDEQIRQLDEQLAQKDFATAQYYQKHNNKQAANLYCQMIMRDWPGTEAAKLAAQILDQNLPGKSIDEKDEQEKP
ncbi:MAG: outer membrane protein assembly factor BamD [Planctomycetota bacterium]|jgi:hypothetical protein